MGLELHNMRALLASVLTLAFTALPAADAAGACVPEHVPGIGQACREGNGWRVLLGDGSSVFTHGGDPVPAAAAAAGFGAEDAPVCAADGEFAGLAVYAYAADRPDRSATYAGAIRSMIGKANALLRAESAGFGRPLEYRMVCDPNGGVTIATAVVAAPFEEIAFDDVVTSLTAQGFSSSSRKYWIWFDGRPPGAPGGTGTIEDDSRKSVSNRNNVGPSWGVTWGFLGDNGARIMMHENGHNLGAVQNSAPHSTGAFHCTDGLDVMCYNDGGPRGGAYTWSACSSIRFDCNNDDYFHPAPGSGNSLQIRWNLAGPENRFVQGCMYRTAPVDAARPAEVAVPSGCRGRPFSASATTLASPATHGGAIVVAPFVDVCWYAGSTQLSCSKSVGPESGVVPASATRASVSLEPGTTGAAATVLVAVT